MINTFRHRSPEANIESSKVCGIIKPGRSLEWVERRVKLNRPQAVNVHKLLRNLEVENIEGILYQEI